MRTIDLEFCSVIAGGNTFSEIMHGTTNYEINDVAWTLRTYDERLYEGPSLWTKTFESPHARFQLSYDCDRATCSWALSGKHFASEDEFLYRGKEATLLREMGGFEGNQKFQEIIDRIWTGATWHVPAPPAQRNYYCEGLLVRMPASGSSEGADIRAYRPC